MLQGGAAFVALGALTLAAAPAHADADQVGWAHANVAGHLGVSQTYITQSETATNSFSGAVENYLTLDASTTATVGAGGVTATTTVNSGRIQVTLDDLDDILEEDDEEDTEDDDAELEEDEDGEDDEAGEDGEESPEAGDDETGDPVEPEPTAEPDPTEGPTEPVAPEPTDDPSDSNDPPVDGGDEEKDAATTSVIELDEENSVLTDGGDEIVLDVTITGATISTTQGWDGAVSRVADADYVENHNPFGISIDFYSVEDVWQVEEEGYDWNDAYTALVASFEFPEIVDFHYPVGEAVAGVGVPFEGGNGGNGGGGNGDGGDDKTPPKNREGDELPKPDPKSDTVPLAQTGSPLVGLIAAGAAIAAGGGAAAYLARRKKKNGEENAETNETAVTDEA